MKENRRWLVLPVVLLLLVALCIGSALAKYVKDLDLLTFDFIMEPTPAISVQVMLNDGSIIWMGAQPKTVTSGMATPKNNTDYNLNNTVGILQINDTVSGSDWGTLAFDTETGTLTMSDVKVKSVRTYVGSLHILVEKNCEVGDLDSGIEETVYVDRGNLIIGGAGTLTVNAGNKAITVNNGNMQFSDSVKVIATTPKNDVVTVNTSSHTRAKLILKDYASLTVNARGVKDSNGEWDGEAASALRVSSAFDSSEAIGEKEAGIYVTDNAKLTVNAIFNNSPNNNANWGAAVIARNLEVSGGKFEVNLKTSARQCAMLITGGDAVFSGGQVVVNYEHTDATQGDTGAHIPSSVSPIYIKGGNIYVRGADVQISDKRASDHPDTSVIRFYSEESILDISSGRVIYPILPPAETDPETGDSTDTATDSNTENDSGAATETVIHPGSFLYGPTGSGLTMNGGHLSVSGLKNFFGNNVQLGYHRGQISLSVSSNLGGAGNAGYSPTEKTFSSGTPDTSADYTPLVNELTVESCPYVYAADVSNNKASNYLITKRNASKIDKHEIVTNISKNVEHSLTYGDPQKTIKIRWPNQTPAGYYASEVFIVFNNGDPPVTLNQDNTSLTPEKDSRLTQGSVVFNVSAGTVTITDTKDIGQIEVNRHRRIDIVVEGTNDITYDAYDNLRAGYLTVRGTGTLNIHNEAEDAYSILAQTSITFADSVKVNLEAPNTNRGSVHTARGENTRDAGNVSMMFKDSAQVTLNVRYNGLYPAGENVSLVITDNSKLDVTSETGDAILALVDTDSEFYTGKCSSYVEISGGAEVTLHAGSAGIRAQYNTSAGAAAPLNGIAGTAEIVIKEKEVTVDGTKQTLSPTVNINSRGQGLYPVSYGNNSVDNGVLDTAKFTLAGGNVTVDTTGFPNEGHYFSALHLNSDKRYFNFSGGTFTGTSVNIAAFQSSTPEYNVPDDLVLKAGTDAATATSYAGFSQVVSKNDLHYIYFTRKTN